nr:PREDICTED: putative RNA polymerase II subunit B1 CTD phosphatase RPAP2 isoform X2 [Megachile rotundata]XP_012143855.1 PREDICTED: putative RNA polymerase II subunit B1 CTD phosphatase RPAP2 isoform X2 [Megachile rotundata]
MQLAIVKKKQCDAKALAIVEQLLEPKINSEWLLDNLKYINKSHMEDVIEERGITKLCGYVLCNSKLTTIIDQQYHISTKKNKVYDVTRRKNFCSSRCYGACNYLLQQMLTSPLWLRDKDEIPVFKVLPAKDELVRSIPGDEIHFNDITVTLNADNKEESTEVNTKCDNLNDATFDAHSKVNEHRKYDTVEDSQAASKHVELHNSEMPNVLEEQYSKNSDEKLGDIKNSSIDLKDITDSVKQQTNDDIVKKVSFSDSNTVLNYSEIEDLDNMNDNVTINESQNENTKNDSEQSNLTTTKKNTDISNNNVQEIEKNEQNRHKRKNVIKERQTNEFYNLAMHIEHSVKEWITEDTISLLSGEEDTKNRLLENIITHDRFLHLCKKLNKLQLEDEKEDQTDLMKSNLKPLPHLSALEEEGKKMELKVRAFYKGSMIVENPKSTENVKQDSDFAPVLPLIDAHAPKALRRRIFLDKLNRILPDLLRALASNKLPQYIYNSEKSALIKALVNTFSLSATNIIFKTAEWTLVGLVIIKMLSMIDPQLKFLLSSKQASMYISMILMSYKLDPNYLDRLMMELINDINISNVDNITNT